MMNLFFYTLVELFNNIMSSDLAINITALIFANAVIWCARKFISLAL